MHSQRFVFPSFGRSSGELLGVNPHWPRILQKLFGNASDDSLLLKDFSVPKRGTKFLRNVRKS